MHLPRFSGGSQLSWSALYPSQLTRYSFAPSRALTLRIASTAYVVPNASWSSELEGAEGAGDASPTPLLTDAAPESADAADCVDVLGREDEREEEEEERLAVALHVLGAYAVATSEYAPGGGLARRGDNGACSTKPSDCQSMCPCSFCETVIIADINVGLVGFPFPCLS